MVIGDAFQIKPDGKRCSESRDNKWYTPGEIAASMGTPQTPISDLGLECDRSACAWLAPIGP